MVYTAYTNNTPSRTVFTLHHGIIHPNELQERKFICQEKGS